MLSPKEVTRGSERVRARCDHAAWQKFPTVYTLIVAPGLWVHWAPWVWLGWSRLGAGLRSAPAPRLGPAPVAVELESAGLLTPHEYR